MTTAPAKPVPAVLDPAQARRDYLWRIPKVRQTLTLVVTDPKNTKIAASICVTELRDTLMLTLREGGSTITKEVRLNLPEARKLSEHLNVICNRVAKRPAHKP